MTESRGRFPHWDHLERLAKALKHAHMTRADMAQRLHLSEGTINNYLTGRTHIPYPTMIAWSNITNVDLDWLMDQDYDPDAKGDSE